MSTNKRVLIVLCMLVSPTLVVNAVYQSIKTAPVTGSTTAIYSNNAVCPPISYVQKYY